MASDSQIAVWSGSASAVAPPRRRRRRQRQRQQQRRQQPPPPNGRLSTMSSLEAAEREARQASLDAAAARKRMMASPRFAASPTKLKQPVMDHGYYEAPAKKNCFEACLAPATKAPELIPTVASPPPQLSNSAATHAQQDAPNYKLKLAAESIKTSMGGSVASAAEQEIWRMRAEKYLKSRPPARVA
eukprot:6194122-Pleurochrysis_carterae.AAC.2